MDHSVASAVYSLVGVIDAVLAIIFGLASGTLSGWKKEQEELEKDPEYQKEMTRRRAEHERRVEEEKRERERQEAWRDKWK